MTRDNRLISIQLEQCANRALAQEGLTSVQAQILLHILRHSEKGTSLTAIHRESGYSMAAISSLIKRLREKGYVRVEPLAGYDRRKLLSEQTKENRSRLFGRVYAEDAGLSVPGFFTRGPGYVGPAAKEDAREFIRVRPT